MSFTENDRKVQSKKGKSFPTGPQYDGTPFAAAIAVALAADFGASPSAVKRVARLTSANERAVRNWFEGKNAPSGENLVGLMRHSDAVLSSVLILADRSPPGGSGGLAGVRRRAVDLLAEIDGLSSLAEASRS